mgnify:CR=1 FL=1
MELKVINEEKNLIEIEIPSTTIAEIMRVYLHKDSGVEFAAWRREHPTKPILLRVETKGKTSKKAIEDAVNLIMKEADSFVADLKKL